MRNVKLHIQRFVKICKRGGYHLFTGCPVAFELDVCSIGLDFLVDVTDVTEDLKRYIVDFLVLMKMKIIYIL